LHHWADPDIGEFVKTPTLPYRVNVYTRADEAMVAVTLEGEQHRPGEIRLQTGALNLTTDHVLVFDAVHKKTQVMPVADELVVKVPALDDGPVIYYLRGLADLATPVVFWRDPRLEVVAFDPQPDGGALNQQQLKGTIRVKAVAPEGEALKLYLYRGEFGPFLSNNFSPIWQVDDEPESGVSVLEVRFPAGAIGQPFQEATLNVGFMRRRAGWE
jgi:hypothetical protein